MEDLKNFFRTSQSEEVFSIPKTLHEVLGLIISRLFNSDISFHVALSTSQSTTEAHDREAFTFFSSAPDFFAEGIPAEFKQVIINIINNAIDSILERKNSSKEYVQGHVSLELELRRDNLNIYIRDNGIGITQEAVTKIFEPYYSTKKEGSGIGLYMSKIILEEHMKGKISASPLPSGAIFTLNVPIINHLG